MAIAVADPPTPLALATTTVAAVLGTGASVVVVDVDAVVLGSTSIVDGGVVATVVATSVTVSSESAAGSVIDRRMTNPAMTATAAAASRTTVVIRPRLSPRRGSRPGRRRPRPASTWSVTAPRRWRQARSRRVSGGGSSVGPISPQRSADQRHPRCPRSDHRRAGRAEWTDARGRTGVSGDGRGRRDTMDFGVFIAPYHPVGESPLITFRHDLELIEWCDQLGLRRGVGRRAPLGGVGEHRRPGRVPRRRRRSAPSASGSARASSACRTTTR